MAVTLLASDHSSKCSFRTSIVPWELRKYLVWRVNHSPTDIAASAFTRGLHCFTPCTYVPSSTACGNYYALEEVQTSSLEGEGARYGMECTLLQTSYINTPVWKAYPGFALLADTAVQLLTPL